MTAAAPMMTAGILTAQGIIPAEMYMSRQIRPVEQVQAAVLLIPVRAAVLIPAREAEQIPAQAAEQIPAQEAEQIPAQAAVRIPAREAEQIPVQAAVLTPAQGRSPEGSNHWTFLHGTCMIIGSGQMAGLCAVCRKYL